MWLKETELESTSVKLIPMRKDHADDIVKAASDGELWKLWYTSVPNQDNVHAYIDEALRQQSEGLALPFGRQSQPKGHWLYAFLHCG